MSNRDLADGLAGVIELYRSSMVKTEYEGLISGHIKEVSRRFNDPNIQKQIDNGVVVHEEEKSAVKKLFDAMSED